MEIKSVFFSDIPNMEKIQEFASLIKDLLFPNYYHEINNIDLLKKTCHFYFGNYISNDMEKEDYFFNMLDNIYSILLSDIQMTYDSDPACNSVEETLISYPGVYAIIYYRIAHILYLLDLKREARIISENAHSKTGIDIHPGATIDNYFFIDHGTGIVIGETTVIDHHVKIYQGVTLGALSFGRGQLLKGEKRHPTIGNYVTFYLGAAILGGDTVIGNNTIIGSNVFITSSIDNNKKVINKKVEIILIDKENS